MTKKSKRKERRYAKNPIANKMVTAQPSLSLVSSSTGITSEPISGISDKVIDEDELVNSLSDTKENNQTEVNSLDNSPSSTTSSRKLHVSPVTVRPHMANTLEPCDVANAPHYDHDTVAIKTHPSPKLSNIPLRRPSHDMSVSSTTNIGMSDAPVLQKAESKKKRKRNQVTSSGDVLYDGQKTDLVVYNGAYQVMDMSSMEADSCLSKVEETDLDKTKSEVVESKLAGHSASNAQELVDMEVDKTNKAHLMNIPRNTDKPSSSMCGENENCEVDKPTPLETKDLSETETPKKKFPDSFEELIVMHFERELNVAEMVESMSCLERDNQVHETELTQLMDQISLLQNINKQLDKSSFK